MADQQPEVAIEKPAGIGNAPMAWGSDAVAQTLRDLDLPYVALNPGSSYRGLHDSLVNYLGNRHPQMLVCLHEEHAVALAHGYAKVTERPMGAAVHSNVGLMHASMAIYNAWCDRAPVVVIGATGPVDAARRRPWIDWIHTARDQGALVRPFVKWDDQPASVEATREALVRAHLLACTPPRGPVYVCLDVAVQEAALDGIPVPPAPSHVHHAEPEPSSSSLREAARLLSGARRPVILAGRVSRDADDWARRIRLAEALDACVVTDLKTAASFPTTHRLHRGSPGFFLEAEDRRRIAEADVILSLDWVDLGGALRQAFGDGAVAARVISASLDTYAANGWSSDYQSLPHVDIAILAASDRAVAGLLEVVEPRREAPAEECGPGPVAQTSSNEVIDLSGLAMALTEAVRGRVTTLIRLPLGWPGALCRFEGPLDYLGYDGGAGLGSGPGMAVGAALALKGTDRLPIAVLGDGDLLMGTTALWTAAHYRIPLLVIVANNRSYHNDEIHQETVAMQRERATENKWIGQRLDDPPVDLPALARAQGWRAGPSVDDSAALPAALDEAMRTVELGEPCLLDVRIQSGYQSNVITSTEAARQ